MSSTADSTQWRPAVASPVLKAGEIHLWRGFLSNAWSKMQIEDLAEDEQDHLKSLRNERVRMQFGVSRWLTREMLARYLQVPLAGLQFSASNYGKPRITGKNTGLQFNRTHSGDCLILAVSRDFEVGVDVEVIKPRTQVEAIVERWFENEEREVWRALPEGERLLYFHQAWTRKEAVLKAWGLGLAQLSDFAHCAAKTTSRSFSPTEGYAGCLAWTSLSQAALSFYTL